MALDSTAWCSTSTRPKPLLSLPNDRTPKVVYDASNPPHIALRIQELYDVNQTPKIALGRVPVVVHILTPGMKPIPGDAGPREFFGASIIRKSNRNSRGNIPNISGADAIYGPTKMR